MNEKLQKLLPARVERVARSQWPAWIADALAYRPGDTAPKLDSPAKAVVSENNDPRNIRVLSRVVKT